MEYTEREQAIIDIFMVEISILRNTIDTLAKCARKSDRSIMSRVRKLERGSTYNPLR